MAVHSSRSREIRFEGLPFDPGIIDSLTVAASLCDRLGRVRAWNREAAMLWGREPADGLSREPYSGAHRLYRPDGSDLAPADTPMAAVLASGVAVTGTEVILARPDGSRRRCLLNTAPLRTEAGEIAGVMTCFQPIIDQKSTTLPGGNLDRRYHELLEALPVALDTADRRRVEEALHHLSAALEERVAARTRELDDTMAELQESDRRFRLLVKSVSDYAIFMLDPDGLVANWNIGAERIKGYSEAEIVGRHFSVFYSDDDRDCGVPQRALAIARASGRFEAEGWRRRKDGSRFWASVVIDSIRDDDGILIGFAKVTRDRTEKRAMEDQLRQAQKMEAIGQLTGGIAHDFNNLLAVVVGNLEALKRRFEGTHGSQDMRFRRLADGALRGADRAAALTRQLLAFSRQQALDPQPIEPAALIDGIAELLGRSLGEQIAVRAAVPPDVWTTFADANQLESALLNLAVNARDAMADGGILTISAANARADAPAGAGYGALQPGEYVVISVTDNGTGMPPPVAAKAFDPFFTTKVSGQGSGLGLSQVYGFARQSGGDAVIESAVGLGTTIRLYLPRFQGALVAPPPSAPGPGAPRADLILLVEDDDLVRPCSLEMVRDLGYPVVAACDGKEALRLLEANPDVRLLFTDLGLPGALGGEELAEQVRLRRPDIKVLFTTGYVQSGKSPLNGRTAGTDMLGKPFTFAGLGDKLRHLLEE
jgi:PAS domain S-box-containing protein